MLRDKKGRFVSSPKHIMVKDLQGKICDLIVDLRENNLFYTGRSKNEKNDDMPQQWIGATRRESLDTCTICSRYQDRTCYAQFGSPSLGVGNIRNAARRGQEYGIEHALKKKAKTARFFRMGAIGDPGSIASDVFNAHYDMVRKEGLGILSYTHQWFMEHAQFLKGKALASCETIEDAKKAINEGWRVALSVRHDEKVFTGESIVEKPQGKVDGLTYILCPAQHPKFLEKGKTVHCNDCGLCDPEKKNVNLIVFAEHGLGAKFARMREEKAQLVQLVVKK